MQRLGAVRAGVDVGEFHFEVTGKGNDIEADEIVDDRAEFGLGFIRSRYV